MSAAPNPVLQVLDAQNENAEDPLNWTAELLQVLSDGSRGPFALAGGTEAHPRAVGIQVLYKQTAAALSATVRLKKFDGKAWQTAKEVPINSLSSKLEDAGDRFIPKRRRCEIYQPRAAP